MTDSSAYFSLNRNEEEESIKLKFPKEITNEVHLGLHQNVNWSIGINSNFVSSNLNLKDLQLSRLTIKNNFSSYSLYLPGKDEKSEKRKNDCDRTDAGPGIHPLSRSVRRSGGVQYVRRRVDPAGNF